MKWNVLLNPDKSGTYLALVDIDGSAVLMEAEYHGKEKWTVELFQTYDPHWDTVDVHCIKWTDFPSEL